MLILEAVQVVLVCGARASSWAGTRRAIRCWPVLLVVIGTAAFGGLGLLVAGTLRAEVTLAAANLVWLILLFCGGIAIPLGKFPHGDCANVLQLLPSAALSDGLHLVLQDGSGPARSALW